MTFLSCDAIHYGYAKKPLFRNLHLELESARFTVIIGANGSGKSTLLRLLCGVLKPESGTVSIGSLPMKKITTKEVSQNLAFVAQENRAVFAFTVRELIRLGVQKLHLEAETIIEEALRQFDLSDLADRSLLSLSGGERQRAHIARGWAQQTPFLLLDEPTAHLDIGHQYALLTLLRQRASKHKCGVVAALHDLNLAAAFADTMVLLHRGEILAQGLPQSVLTEAHLQTAFGIRARVEPDMHGGLRIVPLHESFDEGTPPFAE